MPEALDMQMLLDALEEQLDPATTGDTAYRR